MDLTYVITTIQPPTLGVHRIAEVAKAQDAKFLVIGDRKGPGDWALAGVDYRSIDAQRDLSFKLGSLLPENSYTRKMLGYLIAASSSTQWIRETDDDNIPYDSFFRLPDVELDVAIPQQTSQWLNIYSYFTDRFVWPRGFPLSLVNSPLTTPIVNHTDQIRSPYLLQAVADGDPDVDAIYRLTAPDTSDITFSQRMPLALANGAWSPFNSQATTWPRALFPLMYLPTTCTFRMTDIWRSFVAQRLLPGLGASLVITSATVHQERNEHDLLQDFIQEIPGYAGTEKIREILEGTNIAGDSEHLLDDLRVLYESLVRADHLASEEMSVLEAWTRDMAAIESSRPQ